MTIWAAFSVFTLTVALVSRLAYRAGFAEGRSTVPLRLIRSLANHRVTCAGEAARAVAEDLGVELCLPPDEIRRLQEITPQAAEETSPPEKLRPAL